MFSRWRQENLFRYLFRYLRPHYGLDALDSPLPPSQTTWSAASPAKKPPSARAREARRRLADPEADLPERLRAELATAHPDAVYRDTELTPLYSVKDASPEHPQGVRHTST